MTTTTTAPAPVPESPAVAPAAAPFEVPAASEVLTVSPRQPWSRRGALFLLKAYQGAASGRVSTCRYYPSCSSYAVEAFSLHGFWRAFGLTARRLLRCRPFGPHGIDLVPLPSAAAHTCEPHVDHVAQAGQFDQINDASEVTEATEVRQPC